MDNRVSLVIWVTINTRPGTRGLGTQGPGTQRSSSAALSFYDRNATCDNVLSSNIRLYRCWSLSPHCYTYSRRSSHQIVLFTLSASFLYCMQDYKRNKFTVVIHTVIQGSKVKGQMQIVSRLSRSMCVQAWLCKTDSRVLWGSKESENSVVCYK